MDNEVLFENLDYGNYVIDSDNGLLMTENVKYSKADFNKLHVQRVRLPEGRGNIIYLMTNSFENSIRMINSNNFVTPPSYRKFYYPWIAMGRFMGRRYVVNTKKEMSNRNKEINLGMTNYGIHRDDFTFYQNGNNSKDYSSQGIQKLIILAMKLAEVKIFIEKYNIKPILLLDDLFSELDEKNRNNIFKSLDKNIQVFITTTDLKNINKRIVEKAKIFDLDEGVSK